MSVTKTYEEINDKIKNGKVVVVTADEVVSLAEERGVSYVAKNVDVVTTATFGAMCSSGAFLNFGHSDPPIRMSRVAQRRSRVRRYRSSRRVHRCHRDERDSTVRVRWSARH